jgi:uncharacterized protein (DUF2384 family)
MSERFKNLRGEAKEYVDRVYQVLLDLDEFYEPREAMAWLNRPQLLLDDKRPVELMLTPGGTVQVFAVIGRLRDGAYI